VKTRKTVCGRSVDDFLKTIERFHGWAAPGVVIGGFMVDWAQELLGHEVEADAIVETRHCLPDAVQLFTPCTCGNGWLKILDWDKFALCLYDKKTLNGYRVWMDL
jgi:formylmethanofuran dehydrogenase subunit E